MANQMYSNHARITNWTKAEDKLLENGLAMYCNVLTLPQTWINLAAMLPEKTVRDVLQRYKELVSDVKDIEEGLVPQVEYRDSFNSNNVEQTKCNSRKRLSQSPSSSEPESSNKKARKKNVQWTPEDEDLFVMGIDKYGRGHLKEIRIEFLPHKTAEQVSTYNKKYWIRMGEAAKATTGEIKATDGKKRRRNVMDGESGSTETVANATAALTDMKVEW